METSLLALPLDRARPAGVRVNPPDAAGLVARARRGDARAFGQLYEHFASMVHGILLARVARREVPDLLQDVFLSALRALGRLEEPENVGAWLAAIARNRALDWQRSAGRGRGEDELFLDPVDPRSEQPELPDAEESARALAAVRSLPEAYRETLILRLVEGLTGPEIAARAGLTPGSVRVNLCRGMKLLRERLGGTGAA